MKKLLTIAGLALYAATTVAAEPAGGFEGPDSLRLVTAAEASQLADDTAVKLQGFIVRALGDDKYEFRDDSGTITVEIDREDWGGVKATPQDRIELRGEIDRDRRPARVEVDVDSVHLLP